MAGQKRLPGLALLVISGKEVIKRALQMKPYLSWVGRLSIDCSRQVRAGGVGGAETPLMSQQRKGCIPTNTVFPETGLYTTDESKKQAIFLPILCHDWANIPRRNIFKVKVMVYRAILGMAHAEELFSVAADEQVGKRGSWASHISNSLPQKPSLSQDPWYLKGPWLYPQACQTFLCGLYPCSHLLVTESWTPA